MIHYYQDEIFGFSEIFNDETGTLFRSDVKGTGKDPEQRSFPELIDIGVMGHCESGRRGICRQAGIDCYQKADVSLAPHMSVRDYTSILRQAAGKTFQVALGGAGDPNKHPDFERLLVISRYYGIVPNLTTSGYELELREAEAIRKYAGAAAVSWYSRLVHTEFGYEESNSDTLAAVKMLTDAGCGTNIHFVVSNETIDEAIIRLQEDRFPSGIEAVVFILYKPVGYGRTDKILQWDKRLSRFLHLAFQKHPFRIGFDTCFTPAIVTTGLVSPFSIDACEAAAFSMYIDSRLNAYPCSFGQTEGYRDSLVGKSLREVWNGEAFENFRKRFDRREECMTCRGRKLCRGGCKIGLPIDLCELSENCDNLGME